MWTHSTIGDVYEALERHLTKRNQTISGLLLHSSYPKMILAIATHGEITLRDAGLYDRHNIFIFLHFKEIKTAKKQIICRV